LVLILIDPVFSHEIAEHDQTNIAACHRSNISTEFIEQRCCRPLSA
jgi:hypothetical protein